MIPLVTASEQGRVQSGKQWLHASYCVVSSRSATSSEVGISVLEKNAEEGDSPVFAQLSVRTVRFYRVAFIGI
jgi:hypothetical protein